MKRLQLREPAPARLHVPDFRRVRLTLVGCGGTGSHLASALVALDLALRERGIACEIVFLDPDVVEEKNVGRQLFALADVGQPKAQVLAERLNAAFGTRIGALARAVTKEEGDGATFVGDGTLSIVIGCVDNAPARVAIARAVQAAEGRLWWLDCGNEHRSGQVALGNCAPARALRGAVALGLIDRLPAPHVVYPDLVRPRRRATRAPRSCAEAAAAGEQSLMVNRVVAAYAGAMLHDFLVTRTLRYFAVAVDLQFAGTRAYTLDLTTLAEVTGLKVDQLVGRKGGRR